MHAGKTKILSSDDSIKCDWVDIGGIFVEILKKEAAHKYLGRLMRMDPKERVGIEFQHRIRNCWMKFHQHRKTLCNLLIPIRLRMRLFNAVCTPCILYGLAVLPLSAKQREGLDILQRRMLRLIVDWRRIPNEEWSVTMHRMSVRVDRAQRDFPVKAWQESFHRQRWRFAIHDAKNQKCKWMYRLSQYCPDLIHDEALAPYRKPGRPYTRWDDSLHDYCGYEWSLLHWLGVEFWSREKCEMVEDRYVQYCML